MKGEELMEELLEERNAKITRTMLGTEDHGIVTCWVYLDYDGDGQGFGGYCLDEPRKSSSGRFLGRYGTANGMQFLIELMKVVGVSSWEKLPGSVCRVKQSHSQVYAIGHFLKDEWFVPEEFWQHSKELAAK